MISRAQNSDADNARLLFGWQGKLRGLDFEPPLFRIENMSSPDILNVAGKQVKIPVMLPISHAEAEDREDAIASRDANVLRIVAENPQAATRGLAFEAALSPPPYAIAGKIGQSKTRLSPTGTW